MCTYEKKQQFSPLYSYQKFPRSGQKIRERSQATQRVFWEINYQKNWTGSLSEVDLGGHAHAFDKYLAQHIKTVRVKLPSRNISAQAWKLSKFSKMLIPQSQTADKSMAKQGRATQQSQDAKKTN